MFSKERPWPKFRFQTSAGKPCENQSKCLIAITVSHTHTHTQTNKQQCFALSLGMYECRLFVYLILNIILDSQPIKLGELAGHITSPFNYQFQLVSTYKLADPPPLTMIYSRSKVEWNQPKPSIHWLTDWSRNFKTNWDENWQTNPS